MSEKERSNFKNKKGFKMDTIIVSTDFIREALEERFYKCYNERNWGKQVHEDVFEELVNIVLEAGQIKDITAMDIIDNFLINSDIHYLEEIKEWDELYNSDMTNEEYIEKLQDEGGYIINTEDDKHIVVRNWGF